MGEISWTSAFLDLPARSHPAAVEFWSAVTGYAVSEPRGEHLEFATLVPPEGDDHLRVQRVDDEHPRRRPGLPRCPPVAPRLRGGLLDRPQRVGLASR